MSAMKVDVPREYAHVSPRRKVNFNAPGDKNANDSSFNMNGLKDALDGVPITPQRS